MTLEYEWNEKPTLKKLSFWSAEHDLYWLYEHDHLLLEADSASWFTWLTTHTSFSFRGRDGHCNLLKETRKKSDAGYWYAYQRQGTRIAKRYMGRSVELSTTHLKEIARAFQQTQAFEVNNQHEREGAITASIELTLQAQNAENAAAMIDHYLTGRDCADMHDFSMLRRWLEQLPANILCWYPLLCLHYAHVLSVNYAAQALRWLSLESQHWRGVCLNLLGARAVSCGQLAQATALLQEALTIWANLHHPHGARSCLLLLATVYCEQGVLPHAAACYRRVIQEARKVGDPQDLLPRERYGGCGTGCSGGMGGE